MAHILGRECTPRIGAGNGEEEEITYKPYLESPPQRQMVYLLPN